MATGATEASRLVARALLALLSLAAPQGTAPAATSLRGRAWLLVLLAVAGSPGHAADVGKGGQLYAKHCASCHGSNGVPVMPGTPNFTQPQTMMRSDAAFAMVIRNGRMTMPGYRGLLKESEVYDVIAYMRTLLR